MNLTGFIHDTNPGMGPEVSTVDSGNGFGTRVFWTAVVPDSDVTVNPGAGTAEMHVNNLPELDYFSPDGNAALLSLGPTWQTNYFDATVSFDVVWSGPVTRRVNIRDAANGFAGTFNENQATVTWSETSASGFTFTSNPGSFSTSVPEDPLVNGVSAPLNFFAEVGEERNGVFFPQGIQPGPKAQADNHGADGSAAPAALALPAIGQADAFAPGWEGIDGQPVQRTVSPTPVPALEHHTPAHSGTVATGTLARHALHGQILDQVFADWDGRLHPDVLGVGTA